MITQDIGIWGGPVRIPGGAIRVSTPFLDISRGEVLTERSGRINHGLEGTRVYGAMAGYATACVSGSAWIGVGVTAVAGSLFGGLDGLMCPLPKVNDIAIGAVLILLGIGLVFFFGTPFKQPVAPHLPAIAFGGWSSVPQMQAALIVNVLFLIGIALTLGMACCQRSRCAMRMSVAENIAFCSFEVTGAAPRLSPMKRQWRLRILPPSATTWEDTPDGKRAGRLPRQAAGRNPRPARHQKPDLRGRDHRSLRETTMREANDRGFECFLAEEATESYFPGLKAATLDMIRAGRHRRLDGDHRSGAGGAAWLSRRTLRG